MTEPINIYKNNSNIMNPSKPPIQYFYELKIFLQDNSWKIFKDRSENKYSKLISFNHNIKFNEIKNFTLKIIKLSETEDFFTLSGDLSNSNKIFKTNDLYLEFIENINNMAHCCCYFKEQNDYRLFVTPPNY